MTAFLSGSSICCTSAGIVSTQVKRDLGARCESLPILLASGLPAKVIFRGFFEDIDLKQILIILIGFVDLLHRRNKIYLDYNIRTEN